MDAMQLSLDDIRRQSSDKDAKLEHLRATLDQHEKLEATSTGFDLIDLFLLISTGFPRLLESPGFFSLKFQDLESPGKSLWS